tara:strand:- start:690 stop:1232 length:543 start_codon:yes stop_codon:yes gene_type:complete
MFPNLKTATVSNTSMLGAGVHTVKMASFEEKLTNNGLPYVEVVCENESGSKSYVKFNGVDANTSAAAAKVRTEIFKKFLTNAGATTFENVPASMNSIKGNKFQIVLTEREYWMNDKDTGIPTVRKAFDYKTSGKVGAPLTYTPSMNKPLTGDDLVAYQNAYNAHMQSNGSAPTQGSDLPF